MTAPQTFTQAQLLKAAGRFFSVDREGALDTAAMLRYAAGLVKENKRLRGWYQAIDDASVLWEIAVRPTDDPKLALHHLLCMEIQAALDPRVSAQARQLSEAASDDQVEDAVVVAMRSYAERFPRSGDTFVGVRCSACGWTQPDFGRIDGSNPKCLRCGAGMAVSGRILVGPSDAVQQEVFPGRLPEHDRAMTEADADVVAAVDVRTLGFTDPTYVLRGDPPGEIRAFKCRACGRLDYQGHQDNCLYLRDPERL